MFPIIVFNIIVHVNKGPQLVLWYCAYIITILWCVFHAKPRRDMKPYPDLHTPFFGALFTIQHQLDHMPTFCVEMQEKYCHQTLAFAFPANLGISEKVTSAKSKSVTNQCLKAYFITSPENLQYVLTTNFHNYVKGIHRIK